MFGNLFGKKSVDPRESRMTEIFDRFKLTKGQRKAYTPYLTKVLDVIDDERIERLMMGFDSLTVATESRVITADKKLAEVFPYDRITGVEAAVMKFRLHTKGGTVNIATHDVNTGKSEMVAYIRSKIG